MQFNSLIYALQHQEPSSSFPSIPSILQSYYLIESLLKPL
ncbi:hypothetical protein NEOC65_000562 [Neochlamydia sp. AcF65]|nr:hypothetical protein [Neochlamydia sp. AcF65]MBS4171295.1 hypothetical protein [Neochlamydia sp. AcF95]